MRGPPVISSSFSPGKAKAREAGHGQVNRHLAIKNTVPVATGCLPSPRQNQDCSFYLLLNATAIRTQTAPDTGAPWAPASLRPREPHTTSLFPEQLRAALKRTCFPKGWAQPQSTPPAPSWGGGGKGKREAPGQRPSRSEASNKVLSPPPRTEEEGF